jgi:hypothetical protein
VVERHAGDRHLATHEHEAARVTGVDLRAGQPLGVAIRA